MTGFAVASSETLLSMAVVGFAFTVGSAKTRSPMQITGWPPMSSMRGVGLPMDCVCIGIMLPGATRRVGGGLKVLSGKREVPSGARSLGTILPPAVTRSPGGLPCSLRSFSAFPRLIDGVGDGFFCGAAGASVAATEEGGGRKLLPDDLLARFAEADADGRRTCSRVTQWLDWSLGPSKTKG
jgi:hypothetical protein